MTAHRRRVPAKAKAAPQAATAVVATPPPAPPPPNWPANQPPNPATVTWDSHGLQINASNSSLDQILHAVATDTGAKLQGLSEDQRVFGTYGPGPARDVLSKLLDGTGYNVLMVGGQGDAPPQQIILSNGGAGTPAPVNATQTLRNNSDDENDNPEPQPEQQQPTNEQQYPRPPMRNPFGSGGPPRTPQEIQQEILMRQQQMEQQQEQQQQQNNPQ